jgi:NitT/TauT family transport system substrate-binding protein
VRTFVKKIGVSRTSAAVLAAALVASSGACRRSDDTRLVLATARQPAFALVVIAQRQGYFEARGVAVEQRRFTSGRDALAALLRGEADVATAFTTPVVLADPGAPGLEILTTLHESRRNTRVIARADRGIRRDVDLRGKRIAVTRNTNAEYMLGELLTLAGIPLDAVEMVPSAPDAAVDALVAGEVDAVATWSPLAERATGKIGAGRTVELVSDVYTEASLLLTRREVREGRRAALVAFVRALADAERLVREEPEEAFATLRHEFPESTEAELREDWRRVRLGLGLSNVLVSLLRRESEWFRVEGRLTGPPRDVEALLEPAILAEVEYEAVTFVETPGEGR